MKHLIESLGVPHTDSGTLLINGDMGLLSTITRDGDHIEVHPASGTPPIEPRFILDCHLGRLTAHLRMLGFDCLYHNKYNDQELVDSLQGDDRILLSRDRRLLMRKAVKYGYCPRSLQPYQQLIEVLKRFDLMDKIDPFHRCMRCNHLLEPVSKDSILDQLEPLTRTYFNEFRICTACRQVYWKGSHYERMCKFIDQIVNN